MRQSYTESVYRCLLVQISPADAYRCLQIVPALQTQTSWHFPVEFALDFGALQTETNAHTVLSVELHRSQNCKLVKER